MLKIYLKIAWLTDLHLEFPDTCGLDRFYRKLEKTAADAILISGDIGQATTVIEYLRELHYAAKCPVYFVLGNHDYYYGSIASVRAQAERMYSTDPLRWLNGGVKDFLKERSTHRPPILTHKKAHIQHRCDTVAVHQSFKKQAFFSNFCGFLFSIVGKSAQKVSFSH